MDNGILAEIQYAHWMLWSTISAALYPSRSTFDNIVLPQVEVFPGDGSRCNGGRCVRGPGQVNIGITQPTPVSGARLLGFHGHRKSEHRLVSNEIFIQLQ